MSIYSWQETYLCALGESDDSKLYARILEVRSAFEQRLLSPVGDVELRAMGVAVDALDELERRACLTTLHTSSNGNTKA